MLNMTLRYARDDLDKLRYNLGLLLGPLCLRLVSCFKGGRLPLVKLKRLPCVLLIG